VVQARLTRVSAIQAVKCREHVTSSQGSLDGTDEAAGVSLIKLAQSTVGIEIPNKPTTIGSGSKRESQRYCA